MPVDRQHRKGRNAWSREENHRLLRLREEHKSLSWEKFHELNLFPDRTLPAVQIQYFRLHKGRKKTIRARSRSHAPRTSFRPRRTTAATRHRRAKPRQMNYPIVFDDSDDDDYETDHDDEEERRETSRSETPESDGLQARSRTLPQAPDPSIDDRLQRAREMTSATIQSAIQPSTSGQTEQLSHKLRRPPRPVLPSTTATPEPPAANFSPRVTPTDSKLKYNQVHGSRAWSAVHTIPPSPESTPHSVALVQQFRDPASVAWNTVREPSSTVSEQMHPRPSQEHEGPAYVSSNSFPRPVPAEYYFNEARSFLALWSEATERQHVANMERMEAENTRIRREFEARLSSFDGIAAERDRLREENRELERGMEELKRKTEDDIQRITGVCKTMSEFENLKVLDMLGLKTRQ